MKFQSWFFTADSFPKAGPLENPLSTGLLRAAFHVYSPPLEQVETISKAQSNALEILLLSKDVKEPGLVEHACNPSRGVWFCEFNPSQGTYLDRQRIDR